MKWNELFAKSQSIDVSGKNQMSVEDVLTDYGTITITDYSFCKTSNGDTAFVLFKESPDSFFFAPTVLTNMLTVIDSMPEAKEELITNGFSVTISKSKNKKGNRSYFNFTPADEETETVKKSATKKKK